MILIINTSGTGLEFAMGDKYAAAPADKQSIALPAAAAQFMDACGATWRDLSAIAVVVGPGSFTGIRLGIAYAKGLAIGLNIPVVPVNAFELYLAEYPDAFVAIDSGRGDFFVSAPDMTPGTMTIDEVEPAQMKYPRTVGHKPFKLQLADKIARAKIAGGNIEPVVPMYLRPSYAEQNAKCTTK